MTREEALKKIKQATAHYGDIEDAHVKADQVLCDLLVSLGYDDVVEAYHKVEKWYA